MVAGGDQDWRGKLSSHLDKTEHNLNSVRKDVQQRPTAQSTENRGSGNAFVSRTVSSNTRPIGAGTYGNATTELSSLLAAVQGSLSDLRMEVATAKQLSHHAGAAVVGNVIPSQQRAASSRPVSAPRAAAVASGVFTMPQQLPIQPRQQLIQRNIHPPQIRAPREAFSDFRNVHAAVSSNGYLTGNMLSPPSLSQFSQYDQNFDSPQRQSRSILEVEASINNSVHQVSRVLETKMTDFEKRLDRQINRAVAAPPAVTEAAVAEYSATATDPGQFIAAPSNLAMAFSSPPSTVRPQGHPASESLVLLTMGKADAAERAVTDLRAELEAVRQQHAEALSQMQQQVLTLLDADKRIKEVLSKMAVRMEAFMLQQKDETDALSRALERSEADQRTAVGRCGRDLETVRAESASRCDVMSGRLDAVGVRLGAAEGVNVKVDTVMAQLEGALRRLQKLEEAPASAVSSADSPVLPAVSALQVRDLRLHSSRSLEDDLNERKLKDLDQHLVALQAEMTGVKSDVKMNQEYMSMKMERLAMSVESHRSMDAAALIARTAILEEWMRSVKRGMSINSTSSKNFSFARPSLESLSGTTAAAGAAVVLAGASTAAATARTSAPSGGNHDTREVIASEVAKGEEDGDCSVASLVATGMSQTSVHTFGKGIDFEAHLAAMITETQDELTKIRELTLTALQKRMTRMESYLKDKESWLDEKARDARFEVTEEFARDAYRGLDELKDEVEKRVENLTSQIQELKEERKKHDPAASAVTSVALGAAAAAVAAGGTAYASAAAGGTAASSTGDFLEGASCTAGDLLKAGEAAEEAFTRSAPVQMSNEIAEKALQGLEELREEVELSMDSLREAIQNLQDGPGGAAGYAVVAMSEAVEKLKMEVEQLRTAMAAQQEQLLLVQAEGTLEGQAELLLQTREEQERMTAIVEEQGQQIGGLQAQLSELAHSHHEVAEDFDKDLDKMRSSLSTASAKMQEVSLLHSNPPAEPAAAVELRLDIAELQRRQGILDSCSEVMALRVGAVEQRVECMMAYRLDTSVAAAQKLAAHEHESERLLKLLESCQDVHSLRLQALDAAVSENGHRVTAVERKAEGASAAAEEAVGALSLLEMQLLGKSTSVEGGEEGLIPQLRSEVHRLSIVQAAAQSRGGSEGGGESSRRTKAGPTVAPAIASAAGFGAAVAVSEASKSASYAPSTHFPPEKTAMQSAEWSNSHDALEGHTSVSAAGRLSQTMTTYENPLAGWDSPSQAALDAEQGVEETSTFAAVASQQRLKSSFAPEDAALAVDSRALLSAGEDDVAHLRKALYYQNLSGTAPAGQTLSSQHHDVQGSHGHPSSAVVGPARPSLLSNTPPPLSNPTTKSIMPAAAPSLLTSSWKEEDEDVSTLRMADQPSSSVRGASEEAQTLTEVTLARGVGAGGTTPRSPSRLSGRLPPLGVVVVQEGGDAEGGQLVLSPGSSRLRVMSPASQLTSLASSPSALTSRDVVVGSPRLKALEPLGKVASPRADLFDDRSSQEQSAPLAATITPLAGGAAAGAAFYLAEGAQGAADVHSPNRHNLPPLVSTAAPSLLPPTDALRTFLPLDAPPGMMVTSSSPRSVPGNPYAEEEEATAAHRVINDSDSFDEIPEEEEMYEEEDVEGELAELEASTTTSAPAPAPTYTTTSTTPPENVFTGKTVFADRATKTSVSSPVIPTPATTLPQASSGQLPSLLHVTDDSPPLFSVQAQLLAPHVPQLQGHQQFSESVAEEYPAEPRMERMDSINNSGLFDEGSLSGLDFGEISGEAERFSEMLATPAPAKRALDFRATEASPANSPGSQEECTADVMASGSVVLQVQGTLDFASSDDGEEEDSSDEENNMHMQLKMKRGQQQQAVHMAVHDDDSSSGELEIFRPPPPSSSRAEQRDSPAGMMLSLEAVSGLGSSREEAALGSYRLIITTGSRPGAGTEQDVHLTLIGLSGSSQHLINRDAGEFTGFRFCRGQVDEVLVDAGAELGDITGIQVWHSGEGFSESWHLERVVVEQVATGLSWEFRIKDWVRGGQNGGKTYRYGARTPSGSLSRESSFNRGSAASGLILGDAEGASRGSAAEAASAAAVKLSQQQGGAGLRGRLTGARAFADESFDVDSEPDSPAAVNSCLSSGYAIQKAPAVAQGLRGAMGVVLDEDIEDVDEALRIGPLGNQAPPWQQQQQQGLLPERRSSAGVSASSSGGSDYLSPTGRRAPGLAPSTQGRRSTMFGEPEGFTATPAEPAAHASTTSSGGFTGRPPLPRTPSGTSQRSGSLERLSSSGLPPLGVESMARRSGSGSGGGGAGLSGELSRTGSGSLISSFGDSHEDLPGLSGGGGAAGGGPSRNGGRLVPIHDPAEDEDLAVTPVSAGRGGSGGGPGGSYSRVYGGLMEAEASRTSLDSWDGQSVDGSEASLSLFAPGGIRPPTAGTHVGHLGTSKRRVSFADFAEELLYTPHDYSSDDGSVKSWTEEELLEGQGLNSTTNRSPQQVETARVASAVTDQPLFKRKGPPASEDVFEDVPITGQEVQPHRGTTLVQGSHRVSGPNRRTATTTFKLKVFTADKLNSGLGSTMVNIEMLGSKLTVSQALPREGGDTFLRGSVERFSVDLDPGQEFGEVLAIKVWHEAPSGGFRSLFGDGRWCLERIELEHKLTGTRYVFLNSDRDGWIKAGRKHCVVLKPIKERMDESEDLKVVQEELQAQLLENSSLSTQDRQTLQEKLSKIDSRLLKLRM